MLYKGLSGKAVWDLQRELNREHFKVGAGIATGYFGTATQSAVIKLQNAYGINPDGIVGDVTFIRLARRGQLSEHFHVNEFYSHGNGDLILNHDLLVKLELLRSHLGVPIRISSGYRDPAYNARIDGAKQSQHMYGKAADITVVGYTPKQVAQKAAQAGFRGIGVYGSFTHVDVRDVPARWNG